MMQCLTCPSMVVEKLKNCAKIGLWQIQQNQRFFELTLRLVNGLLAETKKAIHFYMMKASLFLQSQKI